MGRLEQQRWESPDGNRSKVVVKAARVEFLTPLNSSNPAVAQAQAEQANATVELPVDAPVTGSAPAPGTDDDIPF